MRESGPNGSTSRVAVLGCGMMGLGITEVTAVAGIPCVAIKLTPGDLAAPKAKIRASLERRVKKQEMTAEQLEEVLGRIEISGDLGAAANADLVIESALEAQDAKIDLLKKVEAKMHPEAVLGSNTSSLRLETLAAALVRPERFVGLHFFSPVPAMKLVELGVGAKSGEHALQRAEAYSKEVGKTPVRIQSSPGYIVNRLLVPYILHGIETLESGIADAEGIDTAMRLGCGHPMGPLALADLIGLDIVYAMAETMRRELKDPRYEIPRTLKQLFEANQLGRKSDVGLFVYPKEKGAKPSLNPAVRIGR